jgi:dihydrofolate reductase
VAGGADVVQQYLEAGLIDEMQLHVAPLLLGDGVRLFDGRLPDAPRALERNPGDRVAHGRHAPQVPGRELSDMLLEGRTR